MRKLAEVGGRYGQGAVGECVERFHLAGTGVGRGGRGERGNGRGLEAEKIVSRDLDTVGESHGGLLAHIIDSRVAARDAPALLCPVERWQEAWFRDNSFLIACLIHTTSNYTAVPRASVPYSKSFRERNSRRPCPQDNRRAALFPFFLLALLRVYPEYYISPGREAPRRTGQLRGGEPIACRVRVI